MLSRGRFSPIEAEDITGRRVAELHLHPSHGRTSLRYLALLRDGARPHDLPEHWLRFSCKTCHMRNGLRSSLYAGMIAAAPRAACG